MSLKDRGAGAYRPLLPTKQYEGLSAAYGPIIVVEGASDVGYNEEVEVLLPNGDLRRGRVLDAGARTSCVEV